LTSGLLVLVFHAGILGQHGQLRVRVIADGRRARPAGTLITQSCLDSDVPLITADTDFRHVVAHGLRLAV
jgi:hypothetical protein